METCLSQLHPQVQAQPAQNSFRIDSILTGMGHQPPLPPASYSSIQQHSSGAGEALKQFGSMFGKSDADLHLESVSSADDDDESYRKKKKPRTAFSREQVAELEKKFTERKYLSSAERGELAEKLKLSDMQVKTWFQNRRMKYKRQNEETELEVKSPKFPYSPFVPYSSFYSYAVPHYKTMDQMQQQQQQSPSYNCTSPPSTTETYQAPLVLGTNPAHHVSPPPHITSAYFNRAAIAHGVISNGSQSPCYQIGGYVSDYIPAANGAMLSPPYCSSGSSDWQRSPLPTPPAAP